MVNQMWCVGLNEGSGWVETSRSPFLKEACISAQWNRSVYPETTRVKVYSLTVVESHPYQPKKI